MQARHGQRVLVVPVAQTIGVEQAFLHKTKFLVKRDSARIVSKHSKFNA